MGVPIKPQQNFTVVRQIANHTDTDTYYVRAVIRNAYTDAILDTLNLTDRGSQRFSKNWQAPADTSGQGFYISIVTSVYTDSGYTTKSANYGDEENTHLVMELPNVSQRFGGGGTLDSYTIRRIVSEELAKLPVPKEIDLSAFPKQREYEMRWDEVLGAINGLKEALPKETDLSPMLSKLSEAIELIKNKPVTPETDLSPVLSLLDDIKKGMEANYSDVAGIVNDFGEDIKRSVARNMEGVLNRAQFKISPIQLGFQGIKPEKKEKEPELDIKKLSL